MLILLYGQDTYRSRQKLQEIIAKYQSVYPAALSLSRYDAQTFDIQDLRKELSSQAIFKEKKLIVLEHVFGTASFKKEISASKGEFQELKDATLVFWEEGELQRTDPLFKFIAAAGKTQHFPLLTGAKLQNWVVKKVKDNNLSITKEALEFLARTCGQNLWRLSQEILKAAAFKKGEGSRVIQKKDLEALLPQANLSTDIFATIDAAASRNLKKGFALLHSHLEQGDSPLYLFSMLHFQLRNILLVQELGQRSGLHPFIIQKLRQVAAGFSREKLKQLYAKLHELDLAIKKGAIDPVAALDLLLLEMAKK